MRMYVTLVAVAAFLVGLIFLIDRFRTVLRNARRRRAADARLAAALAQAERQHSARQAAAKASAALTTVLPAITKTERGPRRVALPAPARPAGSPHRLGVGSAR